MSQMQRSRTVPTGELQGGLRSRASSIARLPPVVIPLGPLPPRSRSARSDIIIAAEQARQQTARARDVSGFRAQTPAPVITGTGRSVPRSASVPVPAAPPSPVSSESSGDEFPNPLVACFRRVMSCFGKKKKEFDPHGAAEAAHYDADEHEATLPDLCTRLSTSETAGLTSEQAAATLRRDGPNQLSTDGGTPEIVKFLRFFIDPVNIMLEISAAVSFVTWVMSRDDMRNLLAGCVLLGVILVSTIVSYVQERQGGDVMKTLTALMPAQVACVRDGREVRISARDLVVGDLVKIAAGEKLPADLRVVTCASLRVDNSPITGESEPVVLCVGPTDHNPLNSRNLMFCGTLAVDGSGTAFVIRTGDSTLLGKLAAMAASGESTGESTLRRELNYFVRIVTVVSTVLTIAFLVYGVVMKQPVSVLLMMVIGVMVANVPQGLPATVTACLTIAARRLARRHVLVKTLESIETLGSVSFIASDKTGTLTQNRMSVESVFVGGAAVDTPAGNFPGTALGRPDVLAFAQCAALCSRARWVDPAAGGAAEGGGGAGLPGPGGIVADASESALMRFAMGVFGGRPAVEELRAAHGKLFEIPFNSANKWQLSIHDAPAPTAGVPAAPGSLASMPSEPPAGSTPRVLLIKGASEIILQWCARSVSPTGVVQVMTPDALDAIRAAIGGYAQRGFRVLGLAALPLLSTHGGAYGPLRTSEDLAVAFGDLVFLGLAALQDPPRPTVPGAVAICRSAGIKVAMVTGDHPETAAAIARQVGIITAPPERVVKLGVEHELCPDDVLALPAAQAVVIHGSEMPRFTSDIWRHIMSKGELVFARTSPQQKSLIVENAQHSGNVVAVTGDGVNDSPALKNANVGIAMGIAGTEVAKEAADMVLADDEFMSVVVGIEEGRVMYDNLVKSIALTLSHLLPEVMPVLISILLQAPAGITGILILCVDCVAELPPTIVMAYETAESAVMQRVPRKMSRRMVSAALLIFAYMQAGLITTISCAVCFFYSFYHYGVPLAFMPRTDGVYWASGSDPILANETWNGVELDDSAQVALLHRAQTAVYVAIVVGQILNYFTVRCRVAAIWQANYLHLPMIVGVFLAVAAVVLIVFAPPLNYVLGSLPPPWPVWLISAGFGALNVVITEVRKSWIRTRVHIPVLHRRRSRLLRRFIAW